MGFTLDDSETVIPAFSPVCYYCKHYIRPDRVVEVMKEVRRECKAFKHIPLDIWNGRNKHTKPYKGDNGIRFKPIEK